MDDSKRLENIWHGHLRKAEESYSAAFKHACKVQGDYKARDLLSPDGEYALQQALRAENEARARYMTVLETYTHVLVHGELPGDHIANPASPDGWDSAWEKLSDESLEQRLSHYYWLSTLAPNIYQARLAVLIAETERRGKPEIVEKAKARVQKHGSPPPTH